MSELLYIIGTPIGNLSDISSRAIESLKSSGAIFAESPRTSQKLLKHLDISLPLFDMIRIRDSKRIGDIFNKFTTVSLISDAGTPLFSDPGAHIVNYCWENKIEVCPIPGPNAMITCLSCSGYSLKDVYFYGYLANKKGRRINELTRLLETEKKVICFYESKYRI